MPSHRIVGTQPSTALDEGHTTIESSKMQAAQELIEDVIMSTAANKLRPRMLYYLSKENDYGASEGLARYQKSPSVYGEREWMAVIETPPDFNLCTGLFLDKNGKGMTEIANRSGCRNIHLSDVFPKYIYASSDDSDKVNAATKLIIDKIHWAVEQGPKRRQTIRDPYRRS